MAVWQKESWATTDTAMNNATNPEYTDVVHEISHMLFQALWEQEPDLDKKVHELDNIVNKLIRKIGFLVESLVRLKLMIRPKILSYV